MRMMIHPEEVIAFRSVAAEYADVPPFHPGESYPESMFSAIGSEPNPAYAGVRECFRLAGLDQAHFGTSQWNPLGDLMNPGEMVVLKPNLVKESHPRDPNGWRYVITHGSAIRAVADYCWKAIGPGGKLYLADAPQTDSSWDAIVRILGLNEIGDFYRANGLDLILVDLRQEEWKSEGGVVVSRRKLSGDPNGAITFNLADVSEFEGHNGTGNYYGADYDAGEVNRHHRDGQVGRPGRRLFRLYERQLGKGDDHSCRSHIVRRIRCDI